MGSSPLCPPPAAEHSSGLGLTLLCSRVCYRCTRAHTRDRPALSLGGGAGRCPRSGGVVGVRRKQSLSCSVCTSFLSLSVAFAQRRGIVRAPQMNYAYNTILGSTISRRSRANPAVCLRGWTLGPHVCSDLARAGEARAPCPSVAVLQQPPWSVFVLKAHHRVHTAPSSCPDPGALPAAGSLPIRAPFLHRPPPGAAGTGEEGFLSGLLSLPAACAAEPGRSGWAGAALGRGSRAPSGAGVPLLTSASLGAECAP